MKIQKITAAFAAVLMMQALPANAVYQSQDEIAFALRGMETENCGYLAQGNTVYLSPIAAKEGTNVRMGMFIEAEYADVAIIEMELCSTSPAVTFVPESFHNPTDNYTADKTTYVTEDGLEFSTRLKPYCFGYVNSSDVYVHSSAGSYGNFNETNDGFKMMWYASISREAAFFGNRSDEFSFIEMDLAVAPETAAGEYSVYFHSEPTADDPYGNTFITSDESTEDKTIYADFIPAFKNLKITAVSGGDANLDGVTDAADAAAVLIYAAAKGSGGSPVLVQGQEELSCFNANVTTYMGTADEIDAKDASAILQYAAIDGSGDAPDWGEILQ